MIHTKDGTLVESGLTPLTFAGNSSTIYRVTVADYAGIVHSGWGGDDVLPVWETHPNSNTHTLILSSDATIDAFYIPSFHLVKGFTELTNASDEEAPDLTVRAITGTTTLPDDDNQRGSTYMDYNTTYRIRRICCYPCWPAIIQGLCP